MSIFRDVVLIFVCKTNLIHLMHEMDCYNNLFISRSSIVVHLMRSKSVVGPYSLIYGDLS